ncbi:MAG: hypothetical protein AAF716_17955 [Cyanobacteria bacterium P01_D01_bin.1]
MLAAAVHSNLLHEACKYWQLSPTLKDRIYADSTSCGFEPLAREHRGEELPSIAVEKAAI